MLIIINCLDAVHDRVVSHSVVLALKFDGRSSSSRPFIQHIAILKRIRVCKKGEEEPPTTVPTSATSDLGTEPWKVSRSNIAMSDHRSK